MSILSDVHYQVIGQKGKPKLVFLHGLMGFAANWKTIATKFLESFEILLFDQRGHGKSWQPEKGYHPRDYAQDLNAIISELGWDRVNLVGHSMGGRNAVQFSADYPDKLNSLVVVDIGPGSGWESMQSIKAKIEFVPTPFASRAGAREFFEGPFLQKYPLPMLKQFFYANLHQKSDSEFTWKFSKKGVLQSLEFSRHNDHWAEFKGVSCPALLIRGEKSVDLSRETYDQVLQNNSHFQGIQVPGVGHWVHSEDPEGTYRALRNFFATLGLMTT